jgi:o-succinylbenzoate synthase
MEVSLERHELRFAEPVATAYGELRARPLLILTLTDQGASGRGEAAPLEPYDGVSMNVVEAALAAYRPLLAAARSRRGLLDACREQADVPQALAAVDMALWDLAGQRAGSPVCRLLADAPASVIDVNATIAAPDRAAAATQAAAAARSGYRCVKLKVGVGDDAGRVAAVRAALPASVALRLDANGAWSVDQAIRTIEALDAVGLEIVEEPVHGVEEIREVRERTAVRIAIDETAALPGALNAADAVVLKISRCGGISGLLAIAALVRAGGGDVYVSSTFDGPLGIAAAVHAAAALAPLPACGLATLELFDRPSPLPVRDGQIAVPVTPGLGIYG